MHPQAGVRVNVLAHDVMRAPFTVFFLGLLACSLHEDYERAETEFRPASISCPTEDELAGEYDELESATLLDQRLEHVTFCWYQIATAPPDTDPSTPSTASLCGGFRNFDAPSLAHARARWAESYEGGYDTQETACVEEHVFSALQIEGDECPTAEEVDFAFNDNGTPVKAKAAAAVARDTVERRVCQYWIESTRTNPKTCNGTRIF